MLKINFLHVPEFKSHFRLRRDTFEYLVSTLEPFLKTQSASGIGGPPEPAVKQLLITLCMLSNQEIFRFVMQHLFVKFKCYINKCVVTTPTTTPLSSQILMLMKLHIKFLIVVMIILV